MPRRGPRYLSFQLDLTAARANERFDLAGGFIFMLRASTAGSNITIRFDSSQSDEIPFKKGDKLEGRFKTLYISNDAQAGRTIDILITEGPEDFQYFLAVEISTVGLIDTLTTITDPVDVLDRAARLLGVVDGIINPVNISDRAARVLGIVNSITNPVDVEIVASAAQFDQVGAATSNINAAAASTVHVTTGDLPAGLYAIDVMLHTMEASSSGSIKLQWLDSVDAVKEEVFLNIVETNVYTYNLIANMLLDEEIRVFNTGVLTGRFDFWLQWRRLKA